MGFKSIDETETALITYLGIDLESMSLKDNVGLKPFIALLNIGRSGIKPVYSFGIFIPIKTLDKDIKKVYPTLNKIADAFLTIDPVFEFTFESGELKQYEGGILNYCLTIKAKQK